MYFNEIEYRKSVINFLVVPRHALYLLQENMHIYFAFCVFIENFLRYLNVKDKGLTMK